MQASEFVECELRIVTFDVAKQRYPTQGRPCRGSHRGDNFRWGGQVACMPQIVGETIVRTWLAGTLLLVGFGWTDAAVAAAGQDLYGDPLPDGRRGAAGERPLPLR